MLPLVHSYFDNSEPKSWLVPPSHALATNDTSFEGDLCHHVATVNYLHPLQQTGHIQQHGHGDFLPLDNAHSSFIQPRKIFANTQSSLFILQDTEHQFSPDHEHNDSQPFTKHLTRKRHSDFQLNTICTPPLDSNSLSKPRHDPPSSELSRRNSLPSRIIKKMVGIKVLFTTTFDRQHKDNMEREHVALAIWQQTFVQSLLEISDLPTPSAASIQHSETPSSSAHSNSMPPSLSTSSSTLSSMWTPPGININNNNNTSPSVHHINNVVKGERSSKYARFIMMELLSTEETYLEDLYIIKTKFMDPLTLASQQSRPIINNRDIQTIFAFIPQLLLLSTTLVQYLKSAIHDRSRIMYGDNTAENSNNPGDLVGGVLHLLESSFDIYIYYTVNYGKSRKCLERIDCDALCYQILLQDGSIRRKETKRMNLSNFMIAPIQRITRYCLILKDLQKHSPPSPLLHRSLKCMLSLAFTMNEIQ